MLSFTEIFLDSMGAFPRKHEVYNEEINLRNVHSRHLSGYSFVCCTLLISPV